MDVVLRRLVCSPTTNPKRVENVTLFNSLTNSLNFAFAAELRAKRLVLFTTFNNWLSVVDFFLSHMAMKGSRKGKGCVSVLSIRQSFFLFFF